MSINQQNWIYKKGLSFDYNNRRFEDSSIIKISTTGYSVINKQNKFSKVIKPGGNIANKFNIDSLELLTANNCFCADIYLTLDHKVYVSWRHDTESQYPESEDFHLPEYVYELDNKNIVEVCASVSNTETEYDRFSGFYSCISKNGDLYVFGSYLQYWNFIPNSDSSTVYKMDLPEGEKAFKFFNIRNNPILITMKGNCYRYINRVWTKIDISNIVFASYSQNNYIWLVDKDGNLYVSTSNSLTASKIEDATNVKTVWSQNNDIGKVIAITNDNKVLVVHYTGSVWEVTGIDNPITGFDDRYGSNNQFQFYIINDTGDLYAVHMNNIMEDDVIVDYYYYSDKNPSLNWYTIGDIADTTVEYLPPYINLGIDSYSYSYTSGINNVVFKYKFKLNQNISVDGTRNVVNYVPLFL